MSKVRFDWASANGQISQVGEKQTGGHSRKGTQHCQRQEDREGLSRARHSAEFSTCMALFETHGIYYCPHSTCEGSRFREGRQFAQGHRDCT